jgi:hypothetical protein
LRLFLIEQIKKTRKECDYTYISRNGQGKKEGGIEQYARSTLHAPRHAMHGIAWPLKGSQPFPTSQQRKGNGFLRPTGPIAANLASTFLLETTHLLLWRDPTDKHRGLNHFWGGVSRDNPSKP